MLIWHPRGPLLSPGRALSGGLGHVEAIPQSSPAATPAPQTCCACALVCLSVSAAVQCLSVHACAPVVGCVPGALGAGTLVPRCPLPRPGLVNSSR